MYILREISNSLGGETMEQRILEKQGDAKRMVRKVLKEHLRARNSDLWLLFTIWTQEQGIDIKVPENAVNDLILPETIRRVRQQIQNTEGKYLPTDPQVMYSRKIKEEVLRRYYSNNQTILQEYMEYKYGVI